MVISSKNGCVIMLVGGHVSIIRWCKLRMCDDYVVIMWPRPSSFIWAAKPERDQSEPSAKEARHLANLDKLHDDSVYVGWDVCLCL